MAMIIRHILRREARKLLGGHGGLFMSILLLFFLSLLSLIVLSGLLNGVTAGLQIDLKAGVLWLIFLSVLSHDASSTFTEDAADGTFDQDFLLAGGYIPLVVSAFLGQALFLFLPLAVIFCAIWAVGLNSTIPILAVLGLALPVLSFRLLASASALSVGRAFGGGNLLFLSLASPFLLFAVAGRADFIWSMGLILAAFSLGLTPFALSLSHRGR